VVAAAGTGSGTGTSNALKRMERLFFLTEK
jgi:hypothetical protein